MPRYSYTVKDDKGKTITGTDEASDEASLVTHLQSQGYFVTSMQPFSASVSKPEKREAIKSQKYTHSKVKLNDQLIFCHQLATMLDAGVTLLRSLDVICLQVESKDMANVLKQVRKDVEHGNSLSASLAKHPKVFNQFWVSLVEVGEASGTMPTVLEKLAFYLDQKEEFQREIVSAIIYPVILFFVAIGAITFFALFVGPKFKSLFEQFDTKLPLLTTILLGIFDFIKTKFLVIIGVVGAILFIGREYVKTPSGRLQFEGLLFSLPKFGDIYKTIVIERFTSQMAILVDSGVPILYALEITQRLIGNVTAEKVLTSVKEGVRQGKLVADPMAASNFFPPMTIQMIMIGEETGELSKMLSKVSQFYQNSVQTFLKRFGTIFEPFMLVFIGGLIGVIVIAMFLPVFSLSDIGGGPGN
ncbi:MAG: type II secretion system F family protein [Candidatus Omnitrophota bacterium]